MFIKADKVQDPGLKRILEHGLYLALTFILIPSYLFFELGVVLPALVEAWTIAYCIHWICGTFLLVNIVGNMMFGMLTNTSVKGNYFEKYDKADWSLCEVCEIMRPPRAWHCNTCNICILKRDHHCTFFACCIGYFNHRYFMIFVFYIFVSMIYSLYYNVQFLASFISWNNGMVIFKFVLPLVSIVFDFGSETLSIFLVVINVFVMAFSGFLFFYHFSNLIHGKVTAERKLSTKQHLNYSSDLKNNLIEVFGHRWYLTWLSPFVNSPLPGEGISWTAVEKSK